MAGGEREKDRLELSSLSLRSSSSHHRFRAFFTGGGIVGEGVWTEGGGDAMQCECGEDASASARVQFAR
jgi:hypothetical protein